MAQTPRLPSPLGTVVARILGSHDRPVGTAFLAAPDLLLTAAHVANLSLGYEVGSTRRPSGMVVLDFPLLAPGRRFHAEIEHWVPPGEERLSDIAGLRLVAGPPLPASPAPIVEAETSFDLMATVLGFPARADDGAWSIVRLRGGQGTGRTQIDLDQVSQFPIEQGFSGAPVWDPTRGTVLGMVTHAWSRGGPQSAYMVPAEGLFEAWSELRDLARPPSPYPGLRQFTEGDAEVFFGREALANQIAELSTTNPVVTVTGGSGVGKSSLLAAGVIPRLRNRTDTLTVRCIPGEAQTPVRALALALAEAYEPDADTEKRYQAVNRYADAMLRGQTAEIITDLLHRRKRRQLVVIVDQFEQVLAGSKEQIASFGAVLAALVATDGRPCLLLGIRHDFLPIAGKYQHFDELIARAYQIPVPELDTTGLREAIERPLQRLQTVRFEPQLVDHLISEVENQPGRLPLLQFALNRLWERQHDGLVTYSSYREHGDLRSMLTDYADRIWEGLTESEKPLARRLLSQLVHPMPGNDRAFTRRIVQRSDLSDELWAVAGRLAADRLVQLSSADYRDEHAEFAVELAHDSLIVHWNRLAAIAVEDREFRLWQDAIRHRADRWAQRPADRPISYWSQVLRPHIPRRSDSAGSRARLMSIGDLWEARQWRTRRDDLSDVELKYLADSRTRQSVLWTRAAAIVAISAIIPLYLIVDANRELSEIYDLRRSQELAAQSTEIAATNGPLAQLLAASAWQVSKTDEAWNAMSNAVNNPMIGLLDGGHRAPLTTLDLNSDATTMATGDDDGALVLWDTATWIPTMIPEQLGIGIENLEFSPDGTHLAAVSAGEVLIWDVANDSLLHRFNADEGNTYDTSIAYSRDSTMLATGTNDTTGVLRIWNAATAEMVTEISTGNGITELMFNSKGESILAGQSDGMLRQWEIATGNEIWQDDHQAPEPIESLVSSPTNPMHIVDCGTYCMFTDVEQNRATVLSERSGGRSLFSQDGSMMLVHNTSGIAIWNVEQRSIIGVAPTDIRISDLDFGPNGVITAATDDGVLLWSIDRMQKVTMFDIDRTGTGKDLEVLADGTGVVTAGDFGSVTADIVTGETEVEHSPTAGMTLLSAQASPDGSKTAHAFVGAGAPITITDISSGGGMLTINAYPVDTEALLNYIMTMEFSRDGSILAAGFRNDFSSAPEDLPQLSLWDTNSGELIAPLGEFDLSGLKAVAFNHDGSFIAAADGNGIVRIWEVRSGNLIKEFLPESSDVFALEFIGNTPELAIGTGIGLTILNLHDDEAINYDLGDDEMVEEVRSSPDGRYLVLNLWISLQTAIWDTSTGEIAATFHLGTFPRFTPNSNALLMLTDGYMHDIDISFLRDPYSAVCGQSGRTFTDDEWDLYLGDYDPSSLNVCGA
ncbi:trypsin-like peptidase domain-containing protein [Glycomyces sp. NPDC048151]|uniref:nSTAND1 domain-containing NTPase n=1 Tax=Glycomyces sp. NPDC048151 TaxID=3364002 RepID=UPI00372405C3